MNYKRAIARLFKATLPHSFKEVARLSTSESPMSDPRMRWYASVSHPCLLRGEFSYGSTETLALRRLEKKVRKLAYSQYLRLGHYLGEPEP